MCHWCKQHHLKKTRGLPNRSNCNLCHNSASKNGLIKTKILEKFSPNFLCFASSLFNVLSFVIPSIITNCAYNNLYPRN